MPIYCYKCYDCEHYDEVQQKITDEPLTECPQCGGNYKKVIRNVGIIFKGSGFHITDYGKKSVKSAPAGGTPSSDKKETTVKDTSNSESGSKEKSRVATDKTTT
ncbi:MAG: FmdB family zinc ribbon protein [Vulcanimicrobiota bacterium]